MQEYADPVIDFVDTKNVTDVRIYRENCTVFEGSYTKDLSKINRPIKDLILLDNSAHSFTLQKDNGLLIKSFFHFDK